MKAIRITKNEGLLRDYIEIWINGNYDPTESPEANKKGFDLVDTYPIKKNMVSIRLLNQVIRTIIGGWTLIP